MVGLLDIAPVSRKVQIGEDEVEVLGVSARGIAKLLQKFPELRKLMTGLDADLDAAQLIELVPDAIASIIAAGCGYPGNEKAEELVSRLPAQYQLDLLAPILELTMPKGARPFFEQLQTAMRVLGAESLVKTADTISPSQSPSSSDVATA